MKRCVLLALLLLLSIDFPWSARAATPDPESLSGEAAVLMDAQTGQILYGKNAHAVMYPASITKIMTGMLALEHLHEQSAIDASSTAVATPSWGSTAYIQAGERLKVEQALYAMMLKSANEAANVLAEAVAGSQRGFAAMMNERARELGARGTHFTNASGLPAKEHCTTAYDMALITRQALQTPGFLTYFGADAYAMPATNQSAGRSFTNTHRMLQRGAEVYDSTVIGGKTGYTVQAGYTLVTVAERDGRRLICVILDSGSYYADTRTLLDYGFHEFSPILYTFEPQTALEASIIRDGREAGRVCFQAPQSETLWLHNDRSAEQITLEYSVPLQFDEEEDFKGAAILYLPDSSGQPDAILTVPLQAEVAMFPPVATEAGERDFADAVPSRPVLTGVHVAVLLLGSSCFVLLFLLLCAAARGKRPRCRRSFDSSGRKRSGYG